MSRGLKKTIQEGGGIYILNVLTDCSYCKRASNLLESKDKEFVIVALDKSDSYRQFLSKKWKHSTVPIVLFRRRNGREVLIGGYDQLVKLFSEVENDNNSLQTS